MPDAPKANSSGGDAAPGSSAASPDNLEEAMWQLKVHEVGPGRGTDDNRTPRNQYPDRPGVPDCLHFQRTGRCGYGSSCKYNHPNLANQGNGYGYELPQRVGEPNCQYFLKTGSCKYGASCKYHHPKDRQGAWPLVNILGLPMRQDEMACPYYMRNGSCKFGIACKFNHPQPAAIGTVYPPSGLSSCGPAGLSLASSTTLPFIGSVPAWHLSRFPYMSSPRLHGLSCMPVIVPPQGTMPLQQGWSTNMASSNSKQYTMSGLNTPVHFPERPEQPECQYYMKTGTCKYGAYCKYDHPKGRNIYLDNSLRTRGFPSRPGQAVCTFYSTYGSCKYGSACKFDHPVVGYYNYTLPAFPMPDSFASFPQNRISSILWTSAETSPSKASNHHDHHVKHDSTNEPTCSERNDHEDGSLAETSDTQTSSHTPMKDSFPKDHSN